MKVLIACECSGRVRDAFLARGHDAMSCDLLPSETPGPHYQGNVLDILGDGWDMMIAHPECTYLTNAGVRWLHTDINRWFELFEAADFYQALRAAPIPLKAIENPVMHRYAIRLLGSPKRQVVQPHWFGDKAFKATGFELHGLPELIPTNRLAPPPDQVQKSTSAGHGCIVSHQGQIERKTGAGHFPVSLTPWQINGEAI